MSPIGDHAKRSSLHIKPRGPDNNKSVEYKDKLFVFYRLAINDLSDNGMQPFETDDFIFMCNGEIYNHKHLVNTFCYTLTSESDCEIIPYLIRDFGIEVALSMIQGVFAFIFYDKRTDHYLVARDRVGIKSLYTGVNDKNISFCSEMKGLIDTCSYCNMFPAGNFYDSKHGTFTPYESMDFDEMNSVELSTEVIKKEIKSLLVEAVKVRCISSDRPIGCFLSGGLDSSLIAAIVCKHHTDGKVKTFSVGLENATDLLAARKVATHIGSDHHELILTEKQMLDAIPMVIKRIESYDITTVRASTPMVLLSDWIKEHFDTTVIFSGEGADELSGSYKYFNNSPGFTETQIECTRLLKDLQYFDVLRCDKCVSGSGLEARVPFLDFNFVKFYMRIHPSLKDNSQIEKLLLRESFKDDDILPLDILYRKKEAFSDGCSSVENSWFDIINTHCDRIISDQEYDTGLAIFDKLHIKPISKESYWYLTIFCEYYPGQEHIVPYFWLPKWTNMKKPPISARLIL